MPVPCAACCRWRRAFPQSPVSLPPRPKSRARLYSSYRSTRPGLAPMTGLLSATSCLDVSSTTTGWYAELRRGGRDGVRLAMSRASFSSGLDLKKSSVHFEGPAWPFVRLQQHQRSLDLTGRSLATTRHLLEMCLLVNSTLYLRAAMSSYVLSIGSYIRLANTHGTGTRLFGMPVPCAACCRWRSSLRVQCHCHHAPKVGLGL